MPSVPTVRSEQSIASARPARVVAIAVGATFCLALWLLLARWDLSEDIPGGGDDLFPRIVAVLGMLVVAGVAAVVVSPRLGQIAANASFVTWALLFAWRASVARVSGANLWLLPFLFLVLPAAGLAANLIDRVNKFVKTQRVRESDG